ncbi:unnamed protein product [Effrenium voratum]|nr:unnamed protein product [Effrenium voratum]
MSRARDISASLSSVDRYWFSQEGQWPVVVFADNASAKYQEANLSGHFPHLNIRVAVIEEEHLQWPMGNRSCSQNYKRASRFTAGPLWMHQALDNFSHVMLVDTEFVLSHRVDWDPLGRMFEEDVALGYWQTHYEQSWERTLYLTEVSKRFMAGRSLQPQIPELVSYWWDEREVPGGSLPVNIYGCLLAGCMAFFRSELYQSYFQELDRWPGFDEHCWSVQSVLAIAAAFLLDDRRVSELWVYGRHQNSSKTPQEGWNDAKRRTD